MHCSYKHLECAQTMKPSTKACAMHVTTDLKHEGVRGDADVESVGLAPAVALGLALLGAAKVGEQFEGWAPLLELHLPVQHDRCGDHNQVGTPITPAQARSLQPTSSKNKDHKAGVEV